MGLAFMRQGKLAEGLQVLREACQPCPDNLRLLESLSWVLAIGPDPQLRDGAEALRLAERLIRLAKRASPDGSLHPRKLDVLAAAQARAGKYDLAAGNAEAAILRANSFGNQALAAEIQQRLELYKQGRAYEVAP